MNRYSLINKATTHACMEQSPSGDWVPYQDAQQLETQLQAWQESFGTNQLTHALARLEAAEKRAAAMPNDRTEARGK
jgi:hypothetical protein